MKSATRIRDPLETVRRLIDSVTLRSPSPHSRSFMFWFAPRSNSMRRYLRPDSITLDYSPIFTDFGHHWNGSKPAVLWRGCYAASFETRRSPYPSIFSLAFDCCNCGPIQWLSCTSSRELPASRPDRRFSLNGRQLSHKPDLYMELGLTRITPTHDLNGAQVADLAR